MSSASVPADLDHLARDELVAVAHEHMLLGMLANRGILPQVVVRSGSLETMNDVAIDLWMGASPVYTHRMRSLMGITGDGVDAIMKALQLDVGFVHQYMDVVYELHDEHHAEFRLDHCGALLDAEEHGEERVFGMCHTIEDPTFDATALATNPRARIRPVHRPPRVPADRHPHCHWTITIDPANDPVGPAKLTETVAGLPLASVANPRGDGPVDDGRFDASGPFASGLRLGDLASATLAAVAREFQMQTHLLAAAGHLALAERWGLDDARSMMQQAWVGTAAIGSERLAAVVADDDPAVTMARVWAVTGAIPPGFDRAVSIDGGRVRVDLTPTAAGVADPDHPGFVGLCAGADPSGLASIAWGVDRRAVVDATRGDDATVRIEIAPGGGDPREEPDAVSLMRIGRVAAWDFALG